MRNSPKEIGPFSDLARKFNGVKDVSRDFSNSQDNTDRGSMSDQAFACSASSVESLPSASGSSEFYLAYPTYKREGEGGTSENKLNFFIFVPGTQALVRPGSPNSSLSAEDRIHFQQPICLAKALADSQPPPYDKEVLRFKVGTIMPMKAC